ncbi:hypothetical protein BOX15_Mlig012224g2 [Macrostomum lignano]|uniref:Armadillo repeat-containing protein 8 n=1 Tax=Macrostomum lignano TaxID=282301 RepID=A0A267DNA6_9PLAT|nr:hypothetical protein BOX15_Mlig012224g2 [Macrostomum lignano]
MLDPIVARLERPQLSAEDRLRALRELSNYLIGYEDRKREALARNDFRLLDYLLSSLAEANKAESENFSAALCEQLLALLNSLCLADCRARAAALAAGAAAVALQSAVAGARETQLWEQRLQQQQKLPRLRRPRLCQAALRTLRTLVSAQQLLTGPPEPQLAYWEPALAELPDTGAECLTQVSSLNFLLSLLPLPGPHDHLLSLLAAVATDKAAAFHLYAHGAVDSLAPLLLAGPARPQRSFGRRRRDDGGHLLSCLRLLAMLCWRVPDAAGRLLEEETGGTADCRLLDTVIQLLQPRFSTGIRCLAGMCLALAAGHRAAVGAAGSRLQDALLHRVLPDAVRRVQSRSEAVPLAWRCLSLDTLAIVFWTGFVSLDSIAHCDCLLLDGLLERLPAEAACRPLLPRLLRLAALLSPVWPRQPGVPLRSQLLQLVSALSSTATASAATLPNSASQQPPPPDSLRSALLLLLHALSRCADSLLQLFADPGLADFALECLQRYAVSVAEDRAAASAETAVALTGNLLLPHSPCRHRLLTESCLSLLLNLLADCCLPAPTRQRSLRLSLAWALANAAYDCGDSAAWQLLADRLPQLLAAMLDELQLPRTQLEPSVTIATGDATADAAACCKALEALRNLLAGGADRADRLLLARPQLLPLLESALDPCLPAESVLRPAALAALVNAADGGAAARLALLPREALLLRVRDCLSQPELPLPQLSLRIFTNLMEPRPNAEAASETEADFASPDPQCRSVLAKLGFPDQVAKLLDRSHRHPILTAEETLRAERMLNLF